MLNWTGMLHVLDWCVGLVLNVSVMYVLLYVLDCCFECILDWCVELDWCVACTGLVCCRYWTGVLCVHGFIYSLWLAS